MANRPHDDDKLALAADYLEYHTNMYTMTLTLLHDDNAKERCGTPFTNALLVANLVHFRLLYDFLRGTNKIKDTDVLAREYFNGIGIEYEPFRDDFLETWRGKVNTRIVHLTSEPMDPVPLLISEQKWPLLEMARKLLPALKDFLLNKFPEERYPSRHKTPALQHLARFKY